MLSVLSLKGAPVASEAAPKFEPTMTYGKLPVPVYGSFDGNSVGNTYTGITPAEGKTYVLLPWMKKGDKK